MTKVLVTFASSHGATAEIAQVIAKVLRANRLTVDFKRIEDVTRLPEYDAVVMGSAIYVGEWLAEAQAFLNEHVDTLKMQHVWLFSSGPTGEGAPVDLVNGATIPEDLLSLAEAISPRDIIVFHGKIDLRRLRKDERIIVKAADVPKGDFRDWTAIKFWAQQIANALKIVAISSPRQVALMPIVRS